MHRHRVGRVIALAAAAVVASTALSGCFFLNRARVPTPDTSFSVPGGSGGFDVGPNATLPPEWPSDIPAPAGLVLQGVGTSHSGTDGGTVIVATYKGAGNVTAITGELTAGLKRAGYKLDSDFTNGGVGMAVFTKGKVKVQVMTQTQNGEVVVMESAYIDGAG